MIDAATIVKAVEAAAVIALMSSGLSQPHAAQRASRVNQPAADSACTVKELRKSEVQGLKMYSPDRSRFLINKEDDKRIHQLYIGRDGSAELTCISCTQRSGGPKPERMKMAPNWHPSGKWIFVPVERDQYSTPPILGWSRSFVEGMLHSGLWTNMWAVSPDGERWHRLTDFKSGVKGKADGFTGPAMTPDGSEAVWSQIVDGNVFAYRSFGRWELILADYQEKDGVPSFVNLRNITPAGMHWNEPGNFHPDNTSLLFSGSTQNDPNGNDAQGMDQYILNIRTNKLTNLTSSPTVWDEHGRFSPDGKKIIFMSAHPYRDDAKASKVLSIKTEFMLMNSDGTGLVQLTRFKQPGFPESGEGIAASPDWSPDGRSANLRQLFFPKYLYWDVEFEGPCGSSK